LISTFIGDGFAWAGVRAMMAPQSLFILPNYQVRRAALDGRP